MLCLALLAFSGCAPRDEIGDSDEAEIAATAQQLESAANTDVERTMASLSEASGGDAE